MKKTNFTFFKQQAFKSMLFGCLFLLIGALGATGQCSLACNGSTNVSLDNANCEALITVGMVADTSGCPGGDFTVIVNDANGIEIPGALVTSAYVGQTLEVVVLDNVTNNSCWGNLIVEDKLPPTIDCNQMVTDIYCYELDNFTPVAEDNCDSNPEVILTNEVIVVNDCDSGLPENVLKTVTRTYIAEDDQGLQSNECTFTFTVLRIDDLDDIDEPDNLLLADNTNLMCDASYATLPDGNPSPVDIGSLPGTGVPTLDGNDLFPNAYEDCNILVTFEDTDLPPIGCAIKIMRTWTILEWSCSNPQRSYEFIQMIEIVDSEGPTIVCPADLTFSTNGSSCESTMILPTVEVADNCSSTITVDISYPGGFINNSNGGLAQLPMGVNEVTYTAYDECLNATSCTFLVTVADQTPPVVVCDQNTVVALTSDGCAYVHASVFDDGTYDECSDVTLTVRRMDDGVPCDTGSACTTEDDEYFDEYVRFCCVDQAGDVMVVLRATDAAGNVNDCMVNVEVQDKLAPTIVCPAPMTVNCDFPFDESNLNAFFGEPIISDNCGSLEPVDVINTDGLNQCNIGIAVRTISIGEAGTANYAVCTQTITFQAIDLFNDGVEDYYPDTDIFWPEDVTLEGCEDPSGTTYLPENLPADSDFPEYTEGACDLVGANYEDQIFPFNNPNGDACFKIVRTWTVIDWCQFITVNGATTYPSWTHVQIIKINDSVGPEDITTSGPSTMCTYDSDCADGTIELGATSSDECTLLLDWAYTIFTDGDDDGKLDDVLIINNVPQSFNGFSSNSIDASGTYPIGTHKVLYTFSDKCGNVVSEEFEFSIVNCKTPTAYCLNGLAVDLMEDGNGGGTVDMWATDFDAGSSHPCGYDVYVSFDSIYISDNGNIELDNGIKIVVNNGKTYTCDNFGDNLVDIWAAVVTPEGDVIQSYCTATLNVQDNMGVCSGTGNRVSGDIITEDAISLENAEVNLMGSELNNEMTDEYGSYAFPLMPMGGSYSVSPEKNDDYKNGVSTLDLVMIQRHILDLEDINSPYKLIAADINNDEDISASDLLQLRKLILGTISELPNNGSWRFIDANFEFEDPTDPFGVTLPESYDIPTLTSDMDIDFVAIKVGDINSNAVANLTDAEVSTRSDKSVTFEINDQVYQSGNTVSVPVVLTESLNTTGLQFTIETGKGLEFAGITSDVIELHDYNVGFSQMNDGKVTISWNHPQGIALDAEDMVFEMSFVATTDGSLADAMTINSSALNAEMYDENLAVHEIAYTINGRDIGTQEFVLYQNSPNPFAEATDITFELPAAEYGTLTVYNMTGKVVTRVQKSFEKGYNQVTLERAQLGASGVLYYQLEVGKYNASRKMIMID